MKKNIFKTNILLTLLVILGACQPDFLNTDPATEFSELAVWSDPVLVETFINNLYDKLDEPLTDGRLKAMIVDEAHYRGNTGAKNFNNGLITQDGIPAWNYSGNYTWNAIYKSIRSCNIFFENVETVEFTETVTDGKTLKERMLGEVHFIRAFYYFNLANIYGGVPLITEVYTLEGEYEKERSTYEETVRFIIEDLDKAIAMLPDEHTGDNRGRATKAAAMTLKSRVLLYAASDLHNKTVFQDYKNQELLRYTDSNQQARWKEAKDAAKAVMDLNKFSLYKPEPANSDEAAQNYFNLFVSKDTEEDIFVKYFTVSVGQRYGLYTSPNGYRGWGANAPTGNIIDDYKMADGSDFDWDNPEHAAKPYDNREPRFYATILHNGAPWRPRYEEAKGKDPENRIQTGRREVWNSTTNSMELVHGVDTRSGGIENWNGTETGYYVKKHLDPNNDAVFNSQSVTWRFFRYTEVLMNYAEACIELGEEDEARKYINMVRRRAGMPPITSTGDKLKEDYRGERRIEFAFEDHRFFDVRRWVIGPEAYTDAYKADIVYEMDEITKVTNTIPTITHVKLEDRKWVDKMYFFPILRDEMNKNTLLIQNPDY